LSPRWERAGAGVAAGRLTPWDRAWGRLRSFGLGAASGCWAGNWVFLLLGETQEGARRLFILFLLSGHL